MASATKRPIRLGVQVAPQHALYPKIRDTIASLEDAGVDIVFNWDHFFPLSGARDGEHYESWTMLAAIAEQTSRVQLGALVNCNSYRNADLQADMARTIDNISGGRFIFGTGSGWFERDYDEYGYHFGTPGQRLDELADALPRIEARWAKLNPPPIRDIPILIGGGGEKKTLKIVAKHADIWHSFSDAATLKRKLGILGEHCATVGRNIDEIEISTELRGRTEADAAEQLELGVTTFTLGISGPDYDLAPVTKWIAWRDSANG
jgi:probable F420-dependent oxidoreductase